MLLILNEHLEQTRLEQIAWGFHTNFNFSFSSLDANDECGGSDEWYAKLYKVTFEEARIRLANQFLFIDERRENILDGVKRLPIDTQEKIWKVSSFEASDHIAMGLRESLLKDIHRYADVFLLVMRKHVLLGIIDAWCLQALIVLDKISKLEWDPAVKVDFTGGPKTVADYGLYGVPEDAEPYMHSPVTQDAASGHNGGTNVHIGLGFQLSTSN